MPKKTIKIGIVGGAGYVAGELLRLLVHHPQVNIDFVYSTSQAGKSVYTIHSDLTYSDLQFTDKINPNVDVVFLCLGHGNSSQFLENNKFSANTKIIDLSNDFRLKADSEFDGRKYIYGLPELNRQQIISAQNIANPGCFATAIQLSILPLAAANTLNNDIHVHALTGSTGAGQSLSTTSHFSWRNNNISAYKVFNHQHLGEINESLNSLQADNKAKIHFVPLRGDFTRGIFATSYTYSDKREEELIQLYKKFYQDSLFTKIIDGEIHLKQVVNTNYALISVKKIDGKAFITTVIDNLLKGAAGQAIQNMNLMFEFNENTGLNLKASAF